MFTGLVLLFGSLGGLELVCSLTYEFQYKTNNIFVVFEEMTVNCEVELLKTPTKMQ